MVHAPSGTSELSAINQSLVDALSGTSDLSAIKVGCKPSKYAMSLLMDAKSIAKPVPRSALRYASHQTSESYVIAVCFDSQTNGSHARFQSASVYEVKMLTSASVYEVKMLTSASVYEVKMLTSASEHEVEVLRSASVHKLTSAGVY